MRRKISEFRIKKCNWAERKWVVEGRENGKRSRAFFKTMAEAIVYRDEKNIELENFGIEGANLDLGLRVMAQECAKELAERGRTIRDATNFLMAHLKASERSCTAVQLVEELIAAKERDGASERHLSDLRSRLNIFAEKFDGQPVATITGAEIDDWLRSLPIAAVTRNHYRKLIILAFNFALQRKYAVSNPALETAKAKEYRGSVGILTVDQAARLLEAASPEILPFIAIGLFGGLRRAELQRLDWAEVDLNSGLIEVKAFKAKSGQRRLVKIEPNLREWLLPLRRLSGPVTPPQRDAFDRTFNKARIDAGITRWPKNALRHSFASYHLARFQNAAVTSLELGHLNSQVTFAHYRELVRPKEAERYWNLKPAADVSEKIALFASK